MKELSVQFQKLMIDNEIKNATELAQFTGVDVRQIRRIIACDTGVRFIDVATVALYFKSKLVLLDIDTG
jgi:hypothetical protein